MIEGNPDWVYNELSRSLYGPWPGRQMRQLISWDVDPKYGHAIAELLNLSNAQCWEPAG